MTNDKTCEHCRHWQRLDEGCGRCLESGRSSLFGGEGQRIVIATAPNFGCNQFAPKERPKKSSEELTQDFLYVCKKLPELERELERELQDLFAKMLDKED